MRRLLLLDSVNIPESVNTGLYHWCLWWCDY